MQITSNSALATNPTADISLSLNNLDISSFLGNSTTQSALSLNQASNQNLINLPNANTNNKTSTSSNSDILTSATNTNSASNSATNSDTSSFLTGINEFINKLMQDIMAQIQPIIENIIKNISSGIGGGSGQQTGNANGQALNSTDSNSILDSATSLNNASLQGLTGKQTTTNNAGNIGDSTGTPLDLTNSFKLDNLNINGNQPNYTDIPTSTLNDSSEEGVIPKNNTSNQNNNLDNLPTDSLSTKAPTGKLSKEDADAQAYALMQELMNDPEINLSEEQAAGVAGNIYHESAGMNPHVNEIGYCPAGQEYGKPADNVYGYGWCQWTAERKTDYLNFCEQNKDKFEVGSPMSNYAFLKHELTNTSESKVLTNLKNAKTPEEAAFVFRKEYERAAMPIDSTRAAFANYSYDLLKNGGKSTKEWPANI
ncbi:MAG: hypothetical protein RLZZ210_421 [Pseudomonadota bacterium]|jgi:hypothetical protein